MNSLITYFLPYILILIARLGQGPNGTVYICEDKYKPESKCVLKVFESFRESGKDHPKRFPKPKFTQRKVKRLNKNEDQKVHRY